MQDSHVPMPTRMQIKIPANNAEVILIDDFQIKTSNKVYTITLAPEAETSTNIFTMDSSSGPIVDGTQQGEKASFEDMVPEQYRSFRDVFSKDEFDTLPPWKI